MESHVVVSDCFFVSLVVDEELVYILVIIGMWFYAVKCAMMVM